MNNALYLTWAAIAAVAAYFYWMVTQTEESSDNTTVIVVESGSDGQGEATTWLGSLVDTVQGDTTDTVLGGIVDAFQNLFRN